MRPLSMSDVPSLVRVIGDPDVMKYSIRGVCDEAMTRQFIQWGLECFAAHDIGPWALIEKASGALIGFCCLGPEEIDGRQEIGLGYRLATRYWHQGLASEAARAVLAHVFEDMALSSIVALVEPDHLASRKVALKAGLVERELITFHDRPVRVYRQTRAQWKAGNRLTEHQLA
nr:GNAT family N-acetyltransferase [Halomonas sp. S3-1-1]